MKHEINVRRAAIVAVTGILLCGIAAKGQEISAIAAGIPAASTPSRIQIGPGDLLQLTVFDEPGLAQGIRVTDKGDADFLLLGTMHLAGLSTSEAQDMIEKGLKERDFLLNPHVSIIIAEYHTQGISVLGEVKKPGVYPILGGRNLLDILSMAGGTTNVAANSVTIKRRSGQQEKVTTTLSNNPDELLASQVELEPGDTIIVPRAGLVYVLGEVGRPGGFIMQDNGAMSLTQVIALASGIGHAAAETKARIIHKAGLQENIVNLKRVLEGKDPDPQLHADDIVYVPSSAIKSILTRAPVIAQSAASAAVYQGIQALP